MTNKLDELLEIRKAFEEDICCECDFSQPEKWVFSFENEDISWKRSLSVSVDNAKGTVKGLSYSEDPLGKAVKYISEQADTIYLVGSFNLEEEIDEFLFLAEMYTDSLNEIRIALEDAIGVKFDTSIALQINRADLISACSHISPPLRVTDLIFYNMSVENNVLKEFSIGKTENEEFLQIIEYYKFCEFHERAGEEEIKKTDCEITNLRVSATRGAHLILIDDSSGEQFNCSLKGKDVEDEAMLWDPEWFENGEVDENQQVPYLLIRLEEVGVKIEELKN